MSPYLFINYDKPFSGKKLLRDQPDFYQDSERITQKLEETKRIVDQKQRLFFTVIEEHLKTFQNGSVDHLKLKLIHEEDLKEQEKYKKSIANMKIEMERLANREKDLIQKHNAETTNKNREIEFLQGENMRMQNLNKNNQKNMSNKEREYKENMALLTKQEEESAKKAKEYKKKMEELQELLGNIQMRENNLKKKMLETVQVENQKIAAERDRLKVEQKGKEPESL